MTPRREIVTLDEGDLNGWTPITIHFNGSIVPRDMRGKRTFKSRLYAVYSGDLVFSKIDFRNGAIGLLPEEIPQAVVTAEYPAYQIDREQVAPEYLALLLRTAEFRRLVNASVSGTSGRKRAQPGEFIKIEIPLPKIQTQRALATAYHQAKTQADVLEQRATEVHEASQQGFRQELGVVLEFEKRQKGSFIAWFRDIDRWSVESTSREQQGLDEVQSTRYDLFPLGQLVDSSSGGTPSKSCQDYWNGDIPWVSPKDMKSFEIYDSQDHITRKALEVVSLVNSGAALIVVRSGILARLLPVAINRVPVTINQDLKALIPKQGSELDSEFLANYLMAAQKAILKDVKLGTTVHSIVSKFLFEFLVPLPPLKTQWSLVTQMQLDREKAQSLQTQAAQLRESARQELESALTC